MLLIYHALCNDGLWTISFGFILRNSCLCTWIMFGYSFVERYSIAENEYRGILECNTSSEFNCNSPMVHLPIRQYITLHLRHFVLTQYLMHAFFHLFIAWLGVKIGPDRPALGRRVWRVLDIAWIRSGQENRKGNRVLSQEFKIAPRPVEVF